MGYPDKIVIHCEDEKMREHFAFVLRRYQWDLEQLNIKHKGAKQDIIDELILNGKCLKEVAEAGT